MLLTAGIAHLPVTPGRSPQLCAKAMQHLLEADLCFALQESRVKAVNQRYFLGVSQPSSGHDCPPAQAILSSYLCIFPGFFPQVLLLYVVSGVPGVLSQDLLIIFCAHCNSMAVAGML